MISRLIARRVGKAVGKKFRTIAQKKALRKAVLASAKKRRLKVKIKALRSNLAKTAPGTDTVYRVQSKRGRGPLVGFFARPAPPKAVAKGKFGFYKPYPYNPKNPSRMYKIAKSVVGDKGRFEPFNYTKSDKFAFKNLKQAKNYFSKEELDFYSKRGFTLQKLTNVKITGSSPNQVIFRQAKKADKIRSQLSKLESRYARIAKIK